MRRVTGRVIAPSHRRALVAATAFVLVGCWRGSPETRTHPEARTLSIEDRLPLMRDDGSRIVGALRRELGGRGVDGLSVVVLDPASDREAGEFVVQGPAPDGVTVMGRGSVAVAAFLDGPWVPVTAAALQPDAAGPRHPSTGDEPAQARIAQLGEVTVTYREPMVDVRIGPKTVLARRVPSWSATAHSETCGNPWASIDAAWIDRARGLALLRIAYHGPSSDLCWLPDPTLHVLRWP